MKRSTRVTGACFLVLSVVLSGCFPSQPFYMYEDGDLSHYLDTATEVSYPDVHEASLAEATQARKPYTIGDGEPHDFWDLSLEDVISIGLQNTKVIRGAQSPFLQNWAVVSPANDSLVPQSVSALGSLAFQPTIYGPALRETEVGNPSTGRLNDNVAGRADLGPGQLLSANTIANSTGGVEAALSEFDASFNTRLFWDKADRPQNFAFFQPFIKNDSAEFVAELSKKTATGTHLFFRNSTSYLHANTNFINPARPLLVNSTYTTAFEVEARQPLLRGRGTMINRIGIVTARIGTDQQIALVETALQNFLCNLEIRYWDLKCAYRRFETAKKGRDSSLSAWRDVQTKVTGGILAGQDEARAREQYFNFRSELESALCDLYSAEADLRWLMGLASTDGKLIRPIQEPTLARIQFDWASIHAEALGRRPELRSARWEIKKRELQLAYAKNALLPEFNAFALYRAVGVGDNLIGANRNGRDFQPPTASTSRAFDELTGGRFQEAQFGVEMNLPVGFRKELAGVRNAQLNLARDRAMLEDMELDVSRELSQAVRALDSHYQLAQSHLNRWMAAEEEVKKRTEVRQQLESAELDRLLDAQVRRANAQIAYYRSLCEYNKTISLIHRRIGSIMDYCGIQFGEGPWPEKAYFDAMGHARRRDASMPLNYGWTRPAVISRGSAPAITHGDVFYGGSEEIIIDESELQQYEGIPMPAPTREPTPATEPEELKMSSAHLHKPAAAHPSRLRPTISTTVPRDAIVPKSQKLSELGISVPVPQSAGAARRPHNQSWNRSPLLVPTKPH